MLLVPIPYNNFVISVNLQFLSLVKVTLLSIRHFQTNIQPSLLYQNHTHYTTTHSKISYHLSSPFYSTLSSTTPLSSGSIFT
ncbi:hypothetical protein BDR04DRAFT_1101460 [Suillus decipiens]|nr:hypothetical protein BDR04DRAFT_1101460 [Suillus decipiens]